MGHGVHYRSHPGSIHYNLQRYLQNYSFKFSKNLLDQGDDHTLGSSWFHMIDQHLPALWNEPGSSVRDKSVEDVLESGLCSLICRRIRQNTYNNTIIIAAIPPKQLIQFLHKPVEPGWWPNFRIILILTWLVNDSQLLQRELGSLIKDAFKLTKSVEVMLEHAAYAVWPVKGIRQHVLENCQSHLICRCFLWIPQKVRTPAGVPF